MPTTPVPEPITTVRHRFDTWRASRRRGTRIPEPLWDAAAELARRYGVSRTSQALGVAYYSLKERVERRSDTITEDGGLVEVTLPMARGSTECVVEREDGDGSRVRVTLRGDVADVGDLLAGLWRIPR